MELEHLLPLEYGELEDKSRRWLALLTGQRELQLRLMFLAARRTRCMLENQRKDRRPLTAQTTIIRLTFLSINLLDHLHVR